MSTFWQWGKREVSLTFMAESRTATSELLDTSMKKITLKMLINPPEN